METSIDKASTSVVGNTTKPNASLSKQGINTPVERNLEGQLKTLYVRGLKNNRKDVRMAAEEALELYKVNHGLQANVPLKEETQEEPLGDIGDIFVKHNVPLVFFRGLPALMNAMEAQASASDKREEEELKEQAAQPQTAPTAPRSTQSTPSATAAKPVANPMDDALGKIMSGIESLATTVPGGSNLDKAGLSKEIAGLVQSKLASKPATTATPAPAQNNAAKPAQPNNQSTQ